MPFVRPPRVTARAFRRGRPDDRERGPLDLAGGRLGAPRGDPGLDKSPEGLLLDQSPQYDESDVVLLLPLRPGKGAKLRKEAADRTFGTVVSLEHSFHAREADHLALVVARFGKADA